MEYWYIDRHGAVLRQRNTGEPDDGLGDSIMRTWMGWIAWKNYRHLAYPITFCVKNLSDKHGRSYKQYYRSAKHKNDNKNNISRDHLMYVILCLKAYWSPGRFIEELKKIKYKFSDFNKGRMGLHFYFWTRSLTGSKLSQVGYYITSFIMIAINRTIKYIVFKYVGIKGEMHPDNFYAIKNEEKKNYKGHWAIRYLFPAYALHHFVVQLYHVPECRMRSVLQRFTLPLAGEYNYVIRMWLGQEISLQTLEKYRSMTGSRWTNYLHPLINNRSVRFIDPKLKLDYDYMIRVHELTKTIL